MATDPQLTPMMAQYRRIKGELPKDALLLFRLGDFYEMFFEDAQSGAQLLNVALTKRGVVPMCGIPFHAANGYIARILRAGRKVAICDQVEEARPGQLVKREVTQILSPGTHFDERLLAAERNNFLAAVCAAGATFGLALVDLTTGNFKVTEVEGDSALTTELDRLRPAEIIFPAESAALPALLRPTFPIASGYDDWTFLPETALFTLKEHFKVASLDGFGLRGRTASIGAAGAVLHYLAQHLRRDVAHLTSLAFYQPREFLMLDATTLRHLEILEPLHRDAPRQATLYGALNRTVTPMGARCLRDWLSQPLSNAAAITRRQDTVQTLLDQAELTGAFRAQLAEVRDLERTIGRLSVGSGNARDLVALRLALEQMPGLRQRLIAVAQPAGSDDLLRSTTTTLCDAGDQTEPAAIRPTSAGFFGPVFEQLRGQPQAAIAHLLRVRTGEVPGALRHPEIGEIDLAWGDAGPTPGRGYGLAKIAAYHAEVLARLDVLIESMPIAARNDNSIHLDSATHHAVVRTNWKGTAKRWLLTAFEKKDPSAVGRTMDISNPSVEPKPTGMTQLPPSHGGHSELLMDESKSVKMSQTQPTQEAWLELGQMPLLISLGLQVAEFPHLVELLARAIVEEPPLALKEGGLIRDGFDPALDELRGAMRGGKDWIAQLQQQEIERTGIQSLKVRFNSVFGYYIEITKANLDKVPADYVRKQTVATGERFITPELKTMEGKILGAEERSAKLEYELFLKVREEVLQSLKAIQQTATALAQLDVLAAFAETARLHNYCRPRVENAGHLVIRDGRHPVLEQTQTEERFVPNDTALASSIKFQVSSVQPTPPELETENLKLETRPPQIALITGPNMAGKSTYLRQVALLTLLAHTGSFVPATEAHIDLVDRIFTRIGASDDLARGQSTFMVEMCETANILNHATARSLIILDEIGRGTSTFDGLSLAWSIVEHLHHQVGAKTLFATHYHELTELAARLPRLKNFNVAVREWNDQVVFLHKIVEGGADKSYGLQVARLAGVPKTVIDRAKVILRNLEESELTPEGAVRPPARHRAEREKLQTLAANPQLDLFA